MYRFYKKSAKNGNSSNHRSNITNNSNNHNRQIKYKKIEIMGDFGIGAAVGAGLGLLLEKHNDKRQIKQQQKLTDQQTKAQKEIGDYNQKLAMQTWEDTNYDAQRKQMEKAGLNVGLMYGSAGSGGTTAGGTAGGVTGGTANGNSNETLQASQLGLALERQKAEIQNIEADTKVKEATTPNVEASTQSLLAGIENTEAKTILTEIETDIKKLDLDIKDKTREDVIKTINEEWKQAIGKTDSLLAQAKIDNTTYKEKIGIIQQELIAKQLGNDLTKAGIQLTEEQIKKVSNEIQQEWEKIEIQNKQLKLNEQDLKQKAQQIALNKITTEFGTGLGAQTERGARILNATAGAISEFLPTKFTTTTNKQGDKGGDYWEEYTKQTTTKSH